MPDQPPTPGTSPGHGYLPPGRPWGQEATDQPSTPTSPPDSTPGPQASPGWQHPDTPPPPKRGRKRLILLGLAVLGAILLVLGAWGAFGALTIGNAIRPRTVATLPPEPGAAPEVSIPPTPTDIPETTRPAPGKLILGDSGTVTDGFGADEYDITIRGAKGSPRRPRLSRGDEYNRPEHGTWMGVWVIVTAKKDGITVPWGDIYAAVSGRHYDGDACCPDGYEPTLDYATLNQGETVEGWVLFDVPANPKGEIVLRQEFEGGKIATWRF